MRASRSSMAAVYCRLRPPQAATLRPMFRSLLVANRGEVAVRIARAARDAGVRVVGIVSSSPLKASPCEPGLSTASRKYSAALRPKHSLARGSRDVGL